MNTAARPFLILLLVVKFGLALWGALGLIEYFQPSAALGLQDPNFPAGLQFLHFFAILLTGLIFVGGYVTRWPPTRHASVTMYAVLATLCFIETVDFQAFGGGPTRFAYMIAEYVAYTGLSVFLLRSATVRAHFS